MREPVRLGLMPPLTGVAEMYGPSIVRAAQLACDEVNRAGGVLGRALEVIVEDDGSLPTTAIPAAQRLIHQHGCEALIGNLLSNSRIAVVDQVITRAAVPLLNFSFYEGSINNRYFFHFAALPNQQIDAMIPWMARHHGPKFYFAGSNYEWPRGSIDAAKRTLEGIDGTCVGEDYLPLGVGQAEVDDLLRAVGRSGADVFVPFFAGTDQVLVLARFAELGLKGRMAVATGHCDELMVAKLTPHARDGLYSCNTYFMTLQTEENRALLQRLAERPEVRGLWPDGDGVVTNFCEGAYICVHAFATAANRAGTTQGEALLAALETVSLRSAQGDVQMDRLTHHAAVNAYLTRCDARGAFALVEAFGMLAPRIPVRHRHGLSALAQAPADQRPPAIQAGAPTPRYAAETVEQILAVADVAVLATDDAGVIRHLNQRAEQMFGYLADELVGQSVHLLVPPHLRERHEAALRQFVAQADAEGSMATRRAVQGYRKDGSFFPMEASIARIRSDAGPVLVVTMNDITARRLAEDELVKRATHDPLTGLPNRALLHERLQVALGRAQRTGRPLALLYVDLDGFKLVNDTLGHGEGDQLLCSVAARLLELVRPGDTVGRLAGDEFAVLCEQIAGAEGAEALAAQLTTRLRSALSGPAGPIHVSASIGVAVGPSGAETPESLLQRADAAMYAVKKRGGGDWQCYSEVLRDQAAQALAIRSGLRLALARDELSTRVQPILHAETGAVVGGELLLRWRPATGEVSPGEFIPIAEDSGSIVEIGSWVFGQACASEVAWRRRWGARAPYVAVNVSMRQLDEASIVDDFAAALQRSGARAANILLEITETALMANVDASIRVLQALVDLGLRVAVDDFGTGYSSLAQLTRLPVHVLKIDRAFVDGMRSKPEARAIVRAVIGLARALGLGLVGEGVETAEQHRTLSAYGCGHVQGFHFYRPMTADAFVDAVEATLARAHGAAVDDGLYQLVCVSRAGRALGSADLERLGRDVEAYHQRAAITGCSLHDDGSFLHLLEGRRGDVEQALRELSGDARHRDVRVVTQGAVRQRRFSGHEARLRDLTAPLEGHGAAAAARRISLYDLGDEPRLALALLTAHADGPRELAPAFRATAPMEPSGA